MPRCGEQNRETSVLYQYQQKYQFLSDNQRLHGEVKDSEGFIPPKPAVHWSRSSDC